MVASAHWLAATIGLRALEQGGNAFDAAVATALAEGVVMPWACGLGGDMFCVLYDASTNSVHAIDGSGAAPAAASRDYFLDRGQRRVPADGPVSATVPGALDGYLLLHERFGTLPLDRLFEPAIELAAGGIVVSPRLADKARARAGILARSPLTAATFLPDRHPPEIGDVLRQPLLARTLDRIRRGGRATFYEGEIGAEIVRHSTANGGLFAADDFANHRGALVQPASTTYRGVCVYQTPPPSQGLVMLEMLNILEGLPVADRDPCSADAIHLMSEAKRLAFDDRIAHLADPRFVNVPVAWLTSKEHAASRRADVDPYRARPSRPTQEPSDGDTTALCVVDGAGNAITLIHSLAAPWGSGDIAGETGILLNNRAGRGFTLDDNQMSCLAGGRRPPHTLHCLLVTADDRPVLVVGTEGADPGVQWSVQVLSQILDSGLDLQSAIEAPRWHSFPGADPTHRHLRLELQIENRLDEQVVEDLLGRGHRVRLLDPWGAPSSFQAIALDHEREILVGGTDPRVEGATLSR